MTDKAIAVLGAGSWGTALAIHLARFGHLVHLWGHEPVHMQCLSDERVNQAFLPDNLFPESLEVHQGLRSALDKVSDVVIAVPSHAVAAFVTQCLSAVEADIGFIVASKGLDPATENLLPVLLNELLPATQPLALLSGPSFAKEVAAGLPTAVTVAAADKNYLQHVATLFHHESFRVYLSDDSMGVAVGGVVKNVLAIAAGISDGLGFGSNARAALITRGLAEMMRLAIALGAKPETVMGLAGVGDLMLTATDNQSRNRRFGLALGQGHSKEIALEQIGQVVEGLHNATQVCHLAARYNVDMPIVMQVAKVTAGELTPQAAVHELLRRPPREE